LDEHGYLYITGRLKELIKYKGWVALHHESFTLCQLTLLSSSFQVSPMELESVLVQHPCVQEAAVIGIWNSGEETEVPRAYVVIDNDNFRKKISTPDISLALEEFVALKVSTYKRLRGGVVVVDALPRNANGKVLKKHLREMAKDDQIRGVNLTAKL
jgi:acyl-coenzyme A synthetase/AMP-(fatty) acid ligase